MVPILPKMGGPPEHRPSAMINGARQRSIALRGIAQTFGPGAHVLVALQREHTGTRLTQSRAKVTAY